ncbi:MAG: PAS domain S-box protein [Desulfobacteraceae bacterium]
MNTTQALVDQYLDDHLRIRSTGLEQLRGADMGTDKEFQEKLEALREKALARISRSSSDIGTSVNQETRELLHDLHVYQVELELQNEALRQANRELELSRDCYLHLYQNSPVGYVAADSAGIILKANNTFGNMIEKEIDAVFNKPLARFIHPEDQELFLSRYKAFSKKPSDKQLEVRMIRKDQSEIYVKMDGQRCEGDTGDASAGALPEHLLISISDITKRKIAEEAIIQAKLQLEQTFDAVPDLIAIIDQDYTIVRVNLALAQRLGVDPKACVGKKCYHVLHDGQAPPPECLHRQFQRTGRRCEMERYSRKFNGYFTTTVSPFYMDPGANRMCLHILHDITDRKRAEKELLKSRNLESIGTLAGGIAHDFNNILAALIGHLDMANIHLKNEDQLLSHLKNATEASLRARDLANSLITFSKGGSRFREILHVDALLKDTLSLSLSGTNVRYDKVLAADLLPIKVDEAQFKSAIQHIIINAKEAMPWGGTLVVKAKNVELSGVESDAKAGNYVQIEIQDEGSGIAPNHLDRIFDPYFTTKQMGSQKGIGLGLSIAHSIIKKHCGHIKVSSRLDQGTTVTILLPAVSQRTASRHDAHAMSHVPKQVTRKVLFMDDEKMLWEMMGSLLKRLGYDADYAINGQQAISLYRQAFEKGSDYALLILDLTIRGGPGGREVLQKIHKINPEAKAVVFSGYNTDPVFSDHQKYGFVGALQKPFRIEDFIHLMNSVLEREK